MLQDFEAICQHVDDNYRRGSFVTITAISDTKNADVAMISIMTRW